MSHSWSWTVLLHSVQTWIKVLLTLKDHLSRIKKNLKRYFLQALAFLCTTEHDASTYSSSSSSCNQIHSIFCFKKLLFIWYIFPLCSGISKCSYANAIHILLPQKVVFYFFFFFGFLLGRKETIIVYYTVVVLK